jgi:hypothetical protein
VGSILPSKKMFKFRADFQIAKNVNLYFQLNTKKDFLRTFSDNKLACLVIAFYRNFFKLSLKTGGFKKIRTKIFDGLSSGINLTPNS